MVYTKKYKTGYDMGIKEESKEPAADLFKLPSRQDLNNAKASEIELLLKQGKQKFQQQQSILPNSSKQRAQSVGGIGAMNDNEMQIIR